MKSLTLSLLLFVTQLAASAQSRDKILQWVKQHQTDSLVAACALPFEMDLGDLPENRIFKTSSQLKIKFQ
ncbi:hypothetical protein [Chitinophaga caseinilytica]|uniref:Uncharacterized protein n=1 Tax=Chitinophaga caseinilytica TaxID=2267521 RepID=A0ABZ2Z2I3_9BACT